MANRVAICLYGNMRTWEYTKRQLFNFFGEGVDYFLYTTDHTQTDFGYEKDFNTLDIITEESIRSDFRGHNLCAITVDDYHCVQQELNPPNKTIPRALELIYRVNMMKLKYEYNHQFEYDITIFTRPDVIFYHEEEFKWRDADISNQWIVTSHEDDAFFPNKLLSTYDTLIAATNDLANHTANAIQYYRLLEGDLNQPTGETEAALMQYLSQYNIIPLRADINHTVGLPGALEKRVLRPWHGKDISFFDNITYDKFEEIVNLKDHPPY